MLHLVKASRCCSPRERMLAQSAAQSRPQRPPASRCSSAPSRTCAPRRGGVQQCQKTVPQKWSEQEAVVQVYLPLRMCGLMFMMCREGGSECQKPTGP